MINMYINYICIVFEISMKTLSTFAPVILAFPDSFYEVKLSSLRGPFSSKSR